MAPNPSNIYAAICRRVYRENVAAKDGLFELTEAHNMTERLVKEPNVAGVFPAIGQLHAGGLLYYSENYILFQHTAIALPKQHSLTVGKD